VTSPLGHIPRQTCRPRTARESSPVEIDAIITFVGTPPLRPGHYLLWVILDGYDVDPTRVAPPLDLVVTAG
jgi:hypothetical protein